MSELVLIRGGSTGKRIFLATADAALLPYQAHSPRELLRQVKLLALLGYDAVTAAPFIWQYADLQRSIDSLAPALYHEHLLLMGRPGVSSAKAYLNERTQDTDQLARLRPDSPFATEIPGVTAPKIAKQLDDLAPLHPRIDSVESHFLQFFLKDLFPESDGNAVSGLMRRILPVEFSLKARRRMEDLRGALGDLPTHGHFSRGAIESVAEDKDAPQAFIAALAQRATGLYHAANATACGAHLFTWQPAASMLPEGTSYAHQFSIDPRNPYLFMEVLRIFGITEDVIDTLSAQQLRHLLQDAPEVSAFVEWYKRFVTATQPSQICARESQGNFEALLADVEILRKQTSRAVNWHQRTTAIQRKRIDWFLGGTAALLMIAFGKPIFAALKVGGTVRRTSSTALNFLRRRSETAMTKPLGDFEALIIREGLMSLDAKDLEQKKIGHNAV